MKYAVRRSKRKSYSRKGSRKSRGTSLVSLGRTIRDTAPAQFRVSRMARDGVLYPDGASPVAITNFDTGAQAPWVNGFSASSPDTFANSNCIQFGVGCVFKLTDLANSAEFTSLFNEYRIDKIVFKITALGQDAGDQGQVPSAYVSWDPNDGTAPPSSESMQQRSSTRLVDFIAGQSQVVMGIPKAAQQLYTNGGIVSYGFQSNNKNLWIDCSSPSNGTPHYGLKLYFRNFFGVFGGGTALRMQPTYYMSFRRTR